MAVTKKFEQLVAKVIGSNVGDLLRQIGEEAVHQCYTAGKADCAQYALDNLPDAWRDPLATWLRARGVIVQKKAVGSSRYLVGDESGLVKSQKRQQRAFEEAKVEAVIRVTEQTVRTEKKAKELKGRAEERAQKAAVSFLARIKKEDPDAAALLNDKLTRPVSVVDQLEPSAEEMEAAVQAIMMLRMEAGALRRAA